MQRRIAVLAGVVTLVGCGSTAQNSDVPFDRATTSRRPSISDHSGVVITATGPAPTKEDQRVVGTSCKNKMWDPAPSEANAVNLMKQQASARGFNAIHSVKVANDPAAITKNCWSAMVASGIAYNQN